MLFLGPARPPVYDLVNELNIIQLTKGMANLAKSCERP